MNVKKCINIDKIFESIRRCTKRKLAALAAVAALICQMPVSYAESFEDALKSKGYAIFPSIYEVSKDKRFNVSFSREFDTDSARKYIRLVDINGSEVSTYEEKVNPNVFRLTPKQSLEEGAQYYVVVDPGVDDGAGENIISKGLFAKATVQSEGEYTGFVLENAYFTGGKNVKIVFSDELNIESASKVENYEVAGAVPKSAVVFSDRKSVSLTLSQEIGEEQKVDVFVSKDVKSSEFKSLGGDYTKEIMYTDSGAYISGEQPYIKKETAASVSVIEKEQSVENAVIRGDLYIGASGIILEDVQVDGTLYINPGISGKCNIKNVTAQRVEILSGISTEKAIGIDSLQTDILSIKSSMGAYVQINDTDSKSQIYKTIIDLGVVPVTLSSQEGSYGRIEVSSNSMEDGTLKLKLKADVDSALRLYAGCNVESEGEVDMVYIDTPAFEKVELSGEDGKPFQNINVESPVELVVAAGEVGVINYYSGGVLDIGDASVKSLIKNGYYVEIAEEDLSKIGSSRVGDIDSETLRFTLILDEEMYTLGKKLVLRKGDLEILSTCVLQKGLLTTFEIDEQYRESLESGTYDVSTPAGEDWISLDGEQTSYEESGGQTPSDDGKIRYAQAIGNTATSVSGMYTDDVTKIEVIYSGVTKEATLENGEFSWNIFPGLQNGAKITLKAYAEEEMLETIEITVGEEAQIPKVSNVKAVGNTATAVSGKYADTITKVEIVYSGVTKEATLESGSFSWNIFPGLASGTEVTIKGYEGDTLAIEVSVNVE
ncbi:hypothetical protein SAMN02745945_02822 [Peptoclostridium litorale DSM 5388]|uniref:SbsA Ig-like domain-containing protein n=1 Tax=Peptoclostridium litorale DSM 5388 TaxID=1121324 RepID=A0A069RFG6_PEPLI|nr:Ig-like domain-containing protein [Peptoclostridium litorale]KDR94940.1 hypothetical protein CLIT_12c00080 [Peptoclostridium litorale DSM 5388]SIO34030.1 hypothetical protein SAMN02745945_02822 [Peptoclostridium litorale DSM 5388]